ncbi:MAG: hypothetical protein ACSHYF_13595 [Verrucomicrobiaceae bacterium]
MSPERLFQLLMAGGLLAGGWFYGQYWKQVGAPEGGDNAIAELRAQNAELTVELDAARDEIAQVRSLLSKGPFPIPEDLIAFVETDAGLSFLKAPAARLASPEILRNTAELNLEKLFGKSGLEDQQQAWQALGLLSANDSLRGQWIVIETVGARGLIDFHSEEILLAETFDPVSIPDSSVLVHLLMRQLLLQNFPVPEFTNPDAARAWQAVHRGAASSVQARYMRRRSAAEEVEWSEDEREREEILLSLSPAVQGMTNFPYLEGANFAQAAYLESREAFLSIFKTPPSSTFGIIFPEASPPGPAPGPSIGALGLRLMVEPYVGIEAADSMARTWVGDQYITEDDTLTWSISLSSPEAAENLAITMAQIEGPARNISRNENSLTVKVAP